MNPRWSKEETDRLRELYATTMPAREIAEILKRSFRAVYVKARQLGLPKKKGHNHKPLDTEQQQWLRRNFPLIRTGICAVRLGMSCRSVIRIARRMGLEKTPEFMRDCQAFTAKKAQESHRSNGTYPPKGVVNDNIAKGAAFRYKPGHASTRWKKREEAADGR